MATPNASCLRFLKVSRLPPDPSEATSKLLLAHTHIETTAISHQYILRIRSQITNHVATNRGQTKLGQCPQIPAPMSQGDQILSCVCVIDQAVSWDIPTIRVSLVSNALQSQRTTEKLIGISEIR